MSLNQTYQSSLFNKQNLSIPNWCPWALICLNPHQSIFQSVSFFAVSTLIFFQFVWINLSYSNFLSGDVLSFLDRGRFTSTPGRSTASPASRSIRSSMSAISSTMSTQAPSLAPLYANGQAEKEAVEDAKINLEISVANLALAEIKLAASAAKSASSTASLGFYADLQLTIAGSKTNSNTSTSTAVASNITSNGDLTISSGMNLSNSNPDLILTPITLKESYPRPNNY